MTESTLQHSRNSVTAGSRSPIAVVGGDVVPSPLGKVTTTLGTAYSAATDLQLTVAAAGMNSDRSSVGPTGWFDVGVTG